MTEDRNVSYPLFFSYPDHAAMRYHMVTWRIHMIYDKLPVVILSALASEKKDATNSWIASWILEHLEEASSMGIKQIAEACHVGTGSVSRFCKDIGFNDFAEFREALLRTDAHFERTDASSFEARRNAWLTHVSGAMKTAAESISQKQIHKLCEDMRKYEKIAVFGMLKGISAAIAMQVDMRMLGRHVHTSVSYAEQTEYLKQAGKDTLIIIFSYTGSYFSYDRFRGSEKHLVLPKIWMICGSAQKQPAYVDEVILFQSEQDQIGHPYQLQTVESILMQEYAAMKEEEKQ